MAGSGLIWQTARKHGTDCGVLRMETAPLPLAIDPPGFRVALVARWRPLLALCFVIPVYAYAIWVSGRWFLTPFPGFLMMENGVVATVSTFAWPDDRAQLFHSKVIAIDTTTVHSSSEVYAYVAQRPAGTAFRLTVKNGTQETTHIATSRWFHWWDYVQTYGLILLVGGTYMAFGIVVALLQPQRRQARIFFYQALIAGMYPITGVFLHQPDFPWLSRFNLVCECFFGATWIHLALCFPVERRFLGRWRYLPLLPYVVSCVLSALVLRGVFSDPVDLTALHATYSYSAFSTVAFLAALVFSFWENREPLARLRIKAVLPGLLLASVLPFFAFADNALSGRTFPVQFALVPIPILQASLAYAVAKHDLFDIDEIVRQSFIYATLTLTIGLAYTLTLLGPTWLLPSLAGTSPALPNAIFIIALALVLDPLRQAIQHGIDRTFFRSRLDYRATIEELSSQLATLLSPAAIAGSVTRVLSETMHIASIRLCIDSGNVCTVWAREAGGELTSHSADPGVLAAEVPVGMSAFPMEVGGRRVGRLVVSRKRSGRPLNSDDISVLRTLAQQSAVALQNALSYSQLQEFNRNLDAQVQAQTEDLRRSHSRLEQAYVELKQTQAQLLQSEKLASLGQLVAGVAHEINNPASFIHGSLALLGEYLERVLELVHGFEAAAAATPEIKARMEELRRRYRYDYVSVELPELLRICNEGSQRIGRIVSDLRTFARVESLEPESVNVADSIDAVLRLLSHRLADSLVQVEQKYSGCLVVRGQPGQLGQVWMNLLTNAMDAVSGVENPQLKITARELLTNEIAGIEVQIADNGPGIREQDRGKLFEPFFTTKPIGVGTGLGLSITYGIIQAHGGDIELRPRAPRGTVAAVWLPLSPPARPPR